MGRCRGRCSTGRAMNALTREVHDSLAAALAEAADPAVRCVVLTGAGRAFCAGQDLTELSAIAGGVAEISSAPITPTSERFVRWRSRSSRAQRRCGRCGALSRTRLRRRRRLGRAVLVPGFVAIGLVPDAGGTWFLPRPLGFPRAFDWMSSNRRLSAVEALAWGLVSEVVPAGRSRHACRSSGRSGPPAPRPRSPRPSGSSTTPTVPRSSPARSRGRPPAALLRDRRLREGVSAFLEKRARVVHRLR